MTTVNEQESVNQDTTNSILDCDMQMSNKQIIVENVSTSDISLQAISPSYRKINIALGLLTGVLFLLVTGIAYSGWFISLPDEIVNIIPYVIGVILFFTIWNVSYHFFADPLLKYSVREHDINFQSGLIFRSLVSQPILRIQHIEIKRGPIERKYNLATLQVFSAGGASHTFYIPGLEYEHAVALRQLILEHKDLASDV